MQDLSTRTVQEIENLEEIVSRVVPSPGDIPSLAGVEVYGETMPLNGLIGGDHIIYVDFKKRYNLPARIGTARAKGREDLAANLESLYQRAGIVVADVAGHRLTDAILALMLHQAFLLGAMYELDFFGEVTTRLFENLNSRFYNSSTVSKFITMIYGEIWVDGKFRFISAGHTIPVVFSRQYDRFVDISPDMLTTFPPLGTMPSYDDIDQQDRRPPLGYKERYEVNEITLMGVGDILLLYTDGLGDHTDGREEYFPGRVEQVLRMTKDLSARAIFDAIRDDMLSFAPFSDDVTIVVIKRQ